MLIFKDIQDSDLINKFIYKEGLVSDFKTDGEYFGCMDEEQLIGLCKIKIKADKLILIHIHFKDEYKMLALESTLLKCLLFRIDGLDYKELFSLHKNEKLDNLGFRKIDDDYKLIIKDFLISDCNCGVNKVER